MGKKKLTYKNIAEITGLGIGTISRYFNNYNISASAKAKIEKVVEEYNFVPNFSAKMMKKDSSDIYILLPYSTVEWANLELIKGIQDKIKDEYNIFINLLTSNASQYLDHLKSLVFRNPAWLILLLPPSNHEPLNEYIKKISNYKIYLHNRDLLNNKVNNFYDDEKMMRDFTEFVIDNNTIKKIGYIGIGKHDPTTGLKRYKGFYDAVKNKNIEFYYQLLNSNDINEAKEAVTKLLGEGVELIICGTHTIFKAAYNYKILNNLSELKLTDIGIKTHNEQLYKSDFFISLDYYHMGTLIGESIIKNDAIKFNQFKYFFYKY